MNKLLKNNIFSGTNIAFFFFVKNKIWSECLQNQTLNDFCHDQKDFF